MQKFNETGLSKEVVKALTEVGITTPTSIQEQAIPQLLKGTIDFIGLAQTGTGKTAAFGLPLIELINEEMNVTQSLIIAPTRELAVQTAESIQAFAKYKKNITVDVVYGGTPITPQIRQIKSKVPKILVATPGRLIDLVGRKAVHLNNINYVVLDEADEILNMGFKEDIDKILSFTPKEKNTWLFSATMPPEIRRIVKQYMTNPAEVAVSVEERVNKNILHQYVIVNRKDRKEALKRIIDANPEFYGLVFCRTKIEAQELSEQLVAQSYEAGALHGDLSQSQRNQTMKRMKAKVLKILIATDVAARGIDVDDLTHVVHYNLPDDPAFYTHRSGRTARAGKKGKSIVVLNPGTERKLTMLAKKLGINFEKIAVPNEEEIGMNRLNSWIEKVVQADASKVHPDLVRQSLELFTDVSKEDLLAKLLSLELKSIDQSGSKMDINVSDNDRNDRFDRSSRADRDRSGKRDKFGKKDKRDKRDRKDKDGAPRNKSAAGYHRFFINLGTFDKVNKGALLGFICDQADITGQDVGSIELGQRHSYFEVDKAISKKIQPSFKDAKYRGRELRVNRDGGSR